MIRLTHELLHNVGYCIPGCDNFKANYPAGVDLTPEWLEKHGDIGLLARLLEPPKEVIAEDPLIGEAIEKYRQYGFWYRHYHMVVQARTEMMRREELPSPALQWLLHRSHGIYDVINDSFVKADYEWANVRNMMYNSSSYGHSIPTEFYRILAESTLRPY